MSKFNNLNLPVKTGDDFIGELEVMDLSDLKGKTYVVGINQGDPNGVKYLCSSIRGPYTFEEMCEQVGVIWRQHQHHAKVMVLSKDPNKAPVYLDANTIDYIEANYEDIVMESMLDGAFDEVKDYTCRAGFFDGDITEDPRLNSKEEKVESEDAP